MTFDVPHTEDALFGGGVKLVQPAKGYGYRVNADAILLAAFARGARSAAAKLAVDLGAGVGALGLCLWFLGGVRQLVMLERDVRLVEFARHNLQLNGLLPHATAQVCDLRQPLRASAPELLHRADLVIANPPYTEPSRGRHDGHEHKGHEHDSHEHDSHEHDSYEHDRHEHDSHEHDSHEHDAAPAPRTAARQGELLPFLEATADALGHRGKACFVYPAPALVDMLAQARRCGLEAKRLRFVHGKCDRPARIVMVELARARPGGLHVEPPLFEMDSESRPTAELERLLRPPNPRLA